MGRSAVLIILLLAITGCSVGMAMSGKKNPNLGAVQVGSTRGEVELQLGPPYKTASLPNGLRSDMYEYEIGNEPSAGRAIGHGVMDILTFGIWEVVGTPIEGVIGDKYDLNIIYNSDDTVASINAPVKRTVASQNATAPAVAAAPIPAGKSFKLVGVSDDTFSGQETDRAEALLDAKHKACLKGGANIVSAFSCAAASPFAIEVDAEFDELVDPGFDLTDVGYDSDQKTYKVVLAGRYKGGITAMK
jgi:hypothetical protein